MNEKIFIEYDNNHKIINRHKLENIKGKLTKEICKKMKIGDKLLYIKNTKLMRII